MREACSDNNIRNEENESGNLKTLSEYMMEKGNSNPLACIVICALLSWLPQERGPGIGKLVEIEILRCCIVICKLCFREDE